MFGLFKVVLPTKPSHGIHAAPVFRRSLAGLTTTAKGNPAVTTEWKKGDNVSVAYKLSDRMFEIDVA
ncbi:hypothetical protein AeRB84_003420 [Aphanomyces euteiches]|nr:hypothetical protein AeRB84_003420 [Aphanomyces euteiches]